MDVRHVPVFEECDMCSHDHDRKFELRKAAPVTCNRKAPVNPNLSRFTRGLQ